MNGFFKRLPSLAAAAGMICVLALASARVLGSQVVDKQTGAKSQPSKQIKEDRSDFEQALKNFEEQVKAQDWNNGPQLIAARDYLQQFPFTNVNSPLKVRGGSMTIFTSIAGGWEKLTDTTYCVNVKDASQVKVEDLLDKNGDSTTAILPTIVVGWTMTVMANNPDDTSHDHHHHGDNPSGNGLQFASQTGPCKHGETSNHSIILSLVNPEGTDKVGFYKVSLPNVKPWTDNMRYSDRSSGYDPTDDGGKTDGEFRERMRDVTITPVTGNKIVFTCPDGDCAIYIGKPQ